MTSPDYWRRWSFREDGLSPPVSQRAHGYSHGDLILPSAEPRIRLDVQTAVQISTLSEHPMGMAEFLTTTDPVMIGELGPPIPSQAEHTLSDILGRAQIWRRQRVGNRHARRRSDRLRHRIGWVIVAAAVIELATLGKFIVDMLTSGAH